MMGSRTLLASDKFIRHQWTSYIMKVPGKGASKAGGAPAIPPNPDRKPDVEIEEPMFPSQGALYRAAANDLNPLHIGTKQSSAVTVSIC